LAEKHKAWSGAIFHYKYLLTANPTNSIWIKRHVIARQNLHK